MDTEIISWETLLGALKQPPKTNVGWPDLIPSNKPLFDDVAKPATNTGGDGYKGLIEKNGMLLVGDYHGDPEGMSTLYHLVSVLPAVKSIFLEQRVTTVIENKPFMDWLGANMNATASATFAKVIELCLVHARVRAVTHFLPNRRFSKMTVDQAADTFRRWLEAEIALAKLIVSRPIAVMTLFTSSEIIESAEPRKRDEEAWTQFLVGGGVRVFFGGEAHIRSGVMNPDDALAFELLKKSNGILARSAVSHIRQRVLKGYSTGAQYDYDYSINRVTSLGTWKVEQQVPGVSAAPSGTDGVCKHQVFFELYASKPE